MPPGMSFEIGSTHAPINKKILPLSKPSGPPPQQQQSRKDTSVSEAVKAIKKYELQHGIIWDEMPELFTYYTDDSILDLSPWTLIVSDTSLFNLAKVCRLYHEASAKVLKLDPGRARELVKPGLKRLNISRSSKVTDLGIKALCEACSTLEELQMAKVPHVTDIGIREIALTFPMLRVLNLNGNADIRGEGLAVLGECCPLLKELHLAHCRSLQTWSLARIWTSCNHIEVLDLSFVGQLDDEVVRQMSKGCRNLRWLDMTACQQVSDVGILAISHGCPNLECLIVSRTNLLFKITDVSLLALGERCPALQELRIANCNNVTDVGLHWMSQGCKALHTLDLQNCNKVSNHGLRALSDGCQQLTWLSLKNNRLITDTGVKHLAQGCKELTHLDLTGLYLLSDGQNRDFGVEGLQALAQSCIKLKSLNLTGCFRVAKVALRAIGRGLINLEKLVLGKCVNMVEPALVDLFAGCFSLTHVDLSECGTALTDNMVIGLGQYCPYLKTLILIDCILIGAPAMKAIGKGCQALETLDISGCINVDDIGILRLMEGEFHPGLKHIYMHGCTKISSIGLSWLADGCPTLLTMSVKGTSIGASALAAVKDVWSWSEMVQDDTSFGVFPMKRLADRRFMDHHVEQWKMATKLQAICRRKRDKNKIARLREERKRDQAVIKIQAFGRMVIASRERRVRMALVKRRHQAATVIQCMFRQFHSRAVIAHLKWEKYNRMLNGKATKITKIWRGILDRRLVRQKKEDRKVLLRKQQVAVMPVQAAWRGLMARRKFKHLAKRRDRIKAKQQHAAMIIQRVFRGHKGRERARKIKAEQLRVQHHRYQSATKIQARFRGHLVRRRHGYDRYREYLRKLIATTFQIRYRARKAHKAFRSRLLRKQIDREEAAATMVQRYWRRGLAYRQLRELKDQSSQRQAFLWVKCLVIQRYVRGFLARLKMREVKREQERLKDVAAKLEIWAATLVQSCYRRKLARRKVERLKWERKTRWKEMMDEKTQRKFYYNKFSGEVRWRTPQDVLDLMPRSLCSDCAYFEAAIECATCKEFFCNNCYKQVHAGGKRAAHEFRSLYDYYSKRIDYGEGEFPSRWPSDVEQDERNGWSLRISPKRAPMAILPGNWEEYRNENEGPDAKPFYYNKLTGTSSYINPNNQALTRYTPPSPWQKFLDETNMVPFFFNATTQQSTYERPAGYVSPRTAGGSAGGNLSITGFPDTSQFNETRAFSAGAGVTNAFGNTTIQDLQQALTDLSGGWIEHWDSNNDCFYYYNTVTGQSTYDKPQDHYVTTAGGGAVLIPTL